MSLLCPPLPGKAIELFFSTSPKTLSPRFNSALVPRGLDFGIRRFQMQKFQLSSVHGVRDNKPFPASVWQYTRMLPTREAHPSLCIHTPYLRSFCPSHQRLSWCLVSQRSHPKSHQWCIAKPPGKQGHSYQGLDISWRNWGQRQGFTLSKVKSITTQEGTGDRLR